MKPAGCLVDTVRAKPGEKLGMAVHRSERADVRSNGRQMEAIVKFQNSLLGAARTCPRKEVFKRGGGSRRRGETARHVHLGCLILPHPLDCLRYYMPSKKESTFSSLYLYFQFDHSRLFQLLIRCCSRLKLSPPRVDAAIVASPHSGEPRASFVPPKYPSLPF